MCKIQKRIFTCKHTTESHLSNCSNHLKCRAQIDWHGHWEVAIFMKHDCPPCRLKTARAKSRINMIMVTHGTRDPAAINSARLLHQANEQRLRREYGNMGSPFDSERVPRNTEVNKWVPKKPSPLRQVMTPDDVGEERKRKVVVESVDDEDTERKFDLEVEDDEETEEDLEVGPDGGYDEAEDEDEVEWEDIPLDANVDGAGTQSASDHMEGDEEDESPEEGEAAQERRERERKAAIIEYWRRRDSGEVMY